ncbi:ATP synthase subunit delta [Bacteroidia bacterium]|nr:ATP synthase subunit delta [Bacteroidia bacterium]
MNEGLIPSRYAKALLQYAHKQRAEDAVYQQALQITKICKADRRVHSILSNPVLSKQNKVQIIRTIAGNSISPVFEKFINLLVEKKRDDYLQRICLKYIGLYRAQHNIHYARLTTATPIDTATEKRIVDLINSVAGGAIEMQCETNPEVLGGFMIDVDSTRWDATLAAQLRQVQQHFDERNRQNR